VAALVAAVGAVLGLLLVRRRDMAAGTAHAEIAGAA